MTVSQPYIPDREQQKLRQELARQLRLWLKHDDDTLLEENVLADALFGKLQEQFSNADSRDEFFNAAFHALQHFLSDADIRKKNPKYAEETRAQLLRRAELLEVS